MLNSRNLGSRRLVAEKNGHVQILGQMVLLLVINHETLLVVALVVTGVVIDCSGEGVGLVAGQITVHDGDDVIGIVLVIRQHTVHMSDIGLMSVVAVTGGTGKQHGPFSGRSQGNEKNERKALHHLQKEI